MAQDIKQKTALVTRFGGLGDNAPCEVVCRQLKKKGYHVTFATRFDGDHMRTADIFYKNPSFDEVLDYKVVGPWGTRCVKSQYGWVSINTIYSNFDLVIDYMNIIEGNSTSPLSKGGPENVWESSRSSNWVNWYDLHLAWANIDPNSVSDDEKRPKFNLTKEEKAEFDKIKKRYSQVFVLQTTASSLSRTWFQGEKLAKQLLKEYPDSVVFFWDDKDHQWLANDKSGASVLRIEGMSPLRLSMCLIHISSCYVGADTGFTHIAEGLDKKHIAIYSTVPAWTRNKYYKYQVTIDPGIKHPEFYTFNLGLGDPLRAIEGEKLLTEREKLVWKLYIGKVPLKDAAEQLNSDMQGAEMELKALMAKRETFDRQQSKALSSVTMEEVLEKVKEIINEG